MRVMMEEKKPSEGSFIVSKSFLLLFSLILNSVSWFYLIVYIWFLTPTPIQYADELSMIFYVSVLVSMLIGPIIAEKFNRMRFLLFWIILGIISALLPVVLGPTLGKSEVAFLLAFWGVAFGIGFPTCLAFLPSLTRIEKRGRASGAIFCSTYIILLIFFIGIRNLGFFSQSLVLAGWRGLAFVSIFIYAGVEVAGQLKAVSYFSVLRRKTFLLYFLPWLAFAIVNYFEVQVLAGEEFLGASLDVIVGAMEFSLGAIFCLVSGWLMDLRGRRWTIILGLVTLGLGYALLSFFPLNSIVLTFYFITDSVAFGIFTVAFISVVWGDISNGERGEKFYALGTIPILVALALSTLLSSSLESVSKNTAFSLASFFLFLAVIPIFFAPELLPEKVVKEREIRKYAEEAKKIAGRA
jgi:MFS family permease